MSIVLSDSPPVVLSLPQGAQRLSSMDWDGVGLAVYREDIHRETNWRLEEPQHTVIVHLDGEMRSLETEIDGSGACHVPPAPGDIWLVPARRRYASRAVGGVICYAELRVFPDVCVEVSPGHSTRMNELGPRFAHRDEFLYQSVLNLISLGGSDDDLSAMMAQRLQILLRQHLFRGYRHEVAMPTRARNERLSAHDARRISDFVEARLAERITLADLAALTELTVHQLLVAFRQAFATTPAQYILAQRLARARWLLLNSPHDIVNIALATGFSSHSHFTAQFRGRHGVTPREFRAVQRRDPMPRFA